MSATWLPWIGIAVSILTLIFTFIRFGREVHLDDKKEIVNELARCRDRCKELGEMYERIERSHRESLEENRQLKEHNYQLMSRITKLTNGGPK